MRRCNAVGQQQQQQGSRRRGPTLGFMGPKPQDPRTCLERYGRSLSMPSTIWLELSVPRLLNSNILLAV